MVTYQYRLRRRESGTSSTLSATQLFFPPTGTRRRKAGTTNGSAGRIDHPGAVQRHNEALFGGARQQEDGGESGAKRAKVGGDGAA